MGRFKASVVPITFAGLLACGSATPHAAPLADNMALLEVRLAYHEQAHDLERVEFDGKVIFLASDPVISEVDLTNVEPSFNQDMLMLRVRCTDEASQRMEVVSGQHLNQPMAILFEGEVRAAPMVRSAVGCLDVVMGFAASEAEAERIAEKVRERWPEEGM